MYYAHVSPSGEKQTVREHLDGTARRSASFAAEFGEEQRGELLGKAHDIGKCSREFQRRLLENGPKVDHATAGAIECARIGQVMSACCVAGHHGGLPNYGNPRMDVAGEATFSGRIRKGLAKQIPDYVVEEKLPNPGQEPEFRDDFARSIWVRMLYSCLVDGDYLDTEEFMEPKSREEYDSLPVLLQRLERYIEPWFPPQNTLNAYRCEILKQCMDSAEKAPGMYSLTVPTGGGKTVASLAFALKHAVYTGKRRGIYVIPYTSIIEQNAQVFREILGENNVLEHHSGITEEEEGEQDTKCMRRRLATENWDAPVVVTTAVQFFESLYANRASQCRKLHNIAGSVIIFDEAQMLPIGHLRPCVAAISTLVERFRVTAVLCTATQPVLEDLICRYAPGMKVQELYPQLEQNYRRFQRVSYCDRGHISIEEVAGELRQRKQVLCIVNTRKTAQEIFAQLPPEDSYHLSTLMYPEHRKQVLQTLRTRLQLGLPCRVVSTSLIEAGVDIDFPEVYRELAGLDSLMQAAGRCNREGKRNPEESIVTYFTTQAAIPPMQRIPVDATKLALDGGKDPGDPGTIRRYFTELRSLSGETLDISHAVEYLEKGISGCLLPFRTVAEQFHMIDQKTKTLYIPQNSKSDLWQRLLDGFASREDYRKAGRYSVNVYPQYYQTLVDAGDIVPISEDAAVLINLELYDSRMGLSLKADTGKSLFC